MLVTIFQIIAGFQFIIGLGFLKFYKVMHEVETQLQVFIACNILFIFINIIT